MTFHEKINLYRRYLAFLFDFLFSMATMVLICDLLFKKLITLENQDLFYWIWAGAVYLILATRDMTGRSLGKRIFRLKIVSFNENEEVKLYQLVLRNITLFLLPIEIIMFALGKEHLRLGDYMAGTLVIPK